MEWSVLQMGSRKCFVSVVLFIVGWDDLHLEEHLSLVEHFFSFLETEVRVCAINNGHK